MEVCTKKVRELNHKEYKKTLTHFFLFVEVFYLYSSQFLMISSFFLLIVCLNILLNIALVFDSFEIPY